MTISGIIAFRQDDDYCAGMPPYDPRAYPAVAVTVDLVVLTIRDGALAALAVRRGEDPFRDQWALPGGFVREGEGLDAAAGRELHEETGLAVGLLHLEQLATYGAPQRDPRMRVVSVAYLGLAPDLPLPVAGGDASGARWATVDDLLAAGLAFDHRDILADGVERARAKLEYTPLATTFCAAEFTVAELRRVYEIVWGATLDSRNFHRKVTSATGFLDPTGETTTRDGGRPAQLYRRGDLQVLHPPMLRG
jgi:8-oxo-dGTP diphosphatase